MKRICLVGAAVAGLFTAGISSAAIAATPASKTTHTTTTSSAAMLNVSCKLSLASQIPSDGATVTQGGTTGTQYGKAAGCNKSMFRGVVGDSFATDAGGNVSGPIQQWTNTGTMYGKFALTPSQPSGPPTSTSFATENYVGTITITAGKGALRGISGSGTMSCTTSDLAHFSCTVKMKLSPGAG